MSRPRYSIEIEPFVTRTGWACHWAVISPLGFSGGSCAGSIFEAVAQAFHAARRQSRAKSFSVQVVA
jgi:hypothetical protein